MKKQPLVIAIALICIPSYAEETTTQKHITLSEILIATSAPKHLDTPGKTSEEVENTLSARYLFEKDLGVEFASGSNGMITDPVIRGIGGPSNKFGVGGGRVITTIDDIPSSVSSLNFGHHRTGTYIGSNFFDPANLKTLTISRGAAIDKSNVGLGGIIALRTIEPEDILKGETTGVQLRAGYDGRHKEYTVGITGAWQINDNLSGLLAFNRRHGHERQLADGVLSESDLRLFSTYERNSNDILGKLNWQIAPNHQLQLSASHYQHKQDNSEKYSSIISATPELPTQDESKRHSITLKGTHQIQTGFADSIQWTINSQRSKTTQKIDGTQINSSNFPFETISEIYSLQTLSSDTKLLRLAFDKDLDLGNTHHQIHYGIEHRRGRIENPRFSKSKNTMKVFGNVINQTSSEEITRIMPDTNFKEWGAFISDRVVFANTGFSLTPSFKWQRLKKEPDLNTTNTTRQYASPDQTITSTDDAFSFGLLGHWQINEQHSLALNLVKATRIPEILETHAIYYGHWDKIPNPNLRPEHNNMISLEYQMHGSYFDHTITLSHSRIKDYIDFEYVNSTRPDCAATLSSGGYVAIYNRPGYTVINTIEYDADFDFGIFSPKLDGLELSAGFAWTRGRTKDNNQPLLYASPLEAKVRISYYNEKWDTFLQGTFAKGKKEKDLNTNDPFGGSIANPIPGYGVFDLGLNIRPQKNFAISLQIHNLFDKQYLRWSDAAIATKSSGYKEFYQPKRSLSASLRYDF